MTGADVKAIREALGDVLGQRVSQHALGLMLGLAPKNAGDTVRKWEDTAPTGPAAAALRLFSIACDDSQPTPARKAIAREALDMLKEAMVAAMSPAPPQR